MRSADRQSQIGANGPAPISTGGLSVPASANSSSKFHDSPLMARNRVLAKLTDVSFRSQSLKAMRYFRIPIVQRYSRGIANPTGVRCFSCIATKSR